MTNYYYYENIFECVVCGCLVAIERDHKQKKTNECTRCEEIKQIKRKRKKKNGTS